MQNRSEHSAIIMPEEARGAPASDLNTSAVPSTQFLMLSLFLLLLAFFIAMTAGAQFDDSKTAPLIDSLEKVFPVNELRGEGAPSFINLSNDVRNAGQSQEQLDSFFNADAFPFQTQISRETGAYVVTMTTDELDELLSLKPAVVLTNRQKQSFFARLSAFMNPAGVNARRHHLYVLLNTGVNPARTAAKSIEVGGESDQIQRDMAAAQMNKAVGSVERYAMAFTDNGISADNIVIGLTAGRVGSVRLMFVPIEPTAPVSDIGAAPEVINDLNSGNLDRGVLK